MRFLFLCSLGMSVAFHSSHASEPIKPEQLDKLHALIRPQANEDKWTQIPWLANLWEARKRKLDLSPAVQLRIRNFTTQLLANELLVTLRKEYLKDTPALTALYEKNKGAYDQPRVRQILVRMKGSEVALRKGKPDLTPAQAKARAEALLAKLKQGADFATLAKAESDDLGSLSAGGDIGFVPRGSTAAEFQAVATTLPIGQLSGLVKTQYGYHLLRVEERRPMSLDTVRAALAQELAHKKLDEIILNGYKLNAAYFGQ